MFNLSSISSGLESENHTSIYDLKNIIFKKYKIFGKNLIIDQIIY